MALVKVLKDGVEIQSVDLEKLGKLEFSLGRAEGADIRLDDRAVGREHAVISMGSRGFAIHKKSKFGKLSINGAEVLESAIKPGDMVVVADYQLLFEGERKDVALPAKVPEAASVIVNEPLMAELGGLTSGVAPESLDQAQGQPAESPSKNIVLPEGAQPVVETADANSEVKPDEVGSQFNPLEGLNADQQDAQNIKIDKPEPSLVNLSTPGDGGFASSTGDEKTSMISSGKILAKLVFRPGEANVTEYVISKTETSIGRGSNCDIVINDAKSSRKHLVIKRVGVSFVAKDLGSINGTFINGQKITEQSLAGQDKLRIGQTEFEFAAMSKEYADQEHNFISPAALEESPSYNEAAPLGMSSMNGDSPMVSPISPSVNTPGIPQSSSATNAAFSAGALGGIAPPPAKKTSLLEKFKSQPPVRRILILVAAIVVVMVVFGEEEKPKKVQENKTIADSTDAAFNALKQERKEFVANTYELASNLFKNKEFERASHELDRLHEVLPSGYKDSKDYKAYAEKAIKILQAQQEEKRRKEAEEKLRQEVAELVEKAQSLVDKGQDEEAKLVFAEVLEKDPENPTVLRLRQLIEEKENRLRAEAELEREKGFKRKRLQELIAEGRALIKQGRYYEAIERMQDAPVIYTGDAKLLAQAKMVISDAKSIMASKTLPHLKAGREAFDSADFASARDNFLKALKVDSRNAEANKMLAKIGEILHERSKKIYTEAVIAEAVSDFEIARSKYKLCLSQSMPGDVYHGRCERKSKRFDSMDRGVAGEGEPGAALSPDAGPGDPQKPNLGAPALDDPTSEEEP